MKTERVLKVCDTPSGKKYVPGLNVKGEYLNQFGFNRGDLVRMEISTNRILITKCVATERVTDMAASNPYLEDLINELGLSFSL